jgi:hypothetical protein
VRKLKAPWHAFRHSHATALAAKGATPGEIQQALGQSSIEMAMRYTEIAAKAVAKRVASLPALGPVAPSNVIPLHPPKADAPEARCRQRSAIDLNPWLRRLAHV